MNGKQARILRQAARTLTVGLPAVQYNEHNTKRVHLIGYRMDSEGKTHPVTAPSFTRYNVFNSTRCVYRMFKKGARV